MKILVVDDEEEVGRPIVTMLTRLGHASQFVSSAMEALSRFEAQPFDVVLTDLGMPEMNGLELAQQLKAMAPEVRIILITGWSVTLGPQQLSEHGIECVATKPIDVRRLLRILLRK